MPEVKLNLDPHQLARLNNEAAALGVPRAALIRNRALGAAPEGSASGGKVAVTPAAYRSAVEAAARTVSGVPRVHLEAIVAAIITSLHADA
jgi:hypothetical protein